MSGVRSFFLFRLLTAASTQRRVKLCNARSTGCLPATMFSRRQWATMVCYPVGPVISQGHSTHWCPFRYIQIKLFTQELWKFGTWMHLERKWTNHLISRQFVRQIRLHYWVLAANFEHLHVISHKKYVRVCVAPLITPRRTANDQQTTQSSTCLLRFFAKNVLLFLRLLWWQLWYLRFTRPWWAGSPKKNTLWLFNIAMV